MRLWSDRAGAGPRPRLAGEMPTQPVERALPPVRGGGFLIRRALVTVESVLRPGVADDLVRHRGLARQRFAQPLDVGDRDTVFLVAEEAEPGRAQPWRLADQRLEERHPLGHDATPVESHSGPELAPRRDEERHPPAEAEADDPDPGIVEPGLPEVRDGGVDVGDDPRV